MTKLPPDKLTDAVEGEYLYEGELFTVVVEDGFVKAFAKDGRKVSAAAVTYEGQKVSPLSDDARKRVKPS